MAEYNFDAWGRRRNPTDWSYTNVPAPTLLKRGFTGHEHIGEITLINMNGRMYDPVLGMFISCDNFVQSPTRSQNFNRYSYALGNPLKFTDPDGNFFFIMAIGYALMQADIAGNASKNHGGDYWSGFGKSAAVSAVGMAVGFGVGSFVGALLPAGTGALGSTLWGGASGALSGGISGGITNSMFGGSFKSGFINGAIGGGIMGTISGYMSYTTQMSKFTAACQKAGAINANGSIDYNSIVAREIWKSYFGETKGLNNIYTNGEGDDPTISFNEESGYYSNGKTEGAGFTSAIDKTTDSNVYLSKVAFRNRWTLFNVMGHERVHVMDYFSGIWNPRNWNSTQRSEERAYGWNLEQGIKYRVPEDPFYNLKVNPAYEREFFRLINLHL